MIRCEHDILWLEGVCPVEDAEVLLQHAQEGYRLADWSGCTLLHTACLQVVLAARLPLRGLPQDAALAQWLAPLLASTAPMAPDNPQE